MHGLDARPLLQLSNSTHTQSQSPPLDSSQSHNASWCGIIQQKISPVTSRAAVDADAKVETAVNHI